MKSEYPLQILAETIGIDIEISGTTHWSLYPTNEIRINCFLFIQYLT